MTASGRFHDREVAGPGRTQGDDADPVLADLHLAETHYRALRDRWDERETALAAARAELAEERQRARRLETELELARARADRQRDEARRQRERTDGLRAAVKELHLSLFRGGLHAQLLHTCLSITGATRGLYVTATGHDDGTLRVRASSGVKGYPRARPSDYVAALCRRVIEGRRTIVCNAADDDPSLPAATDERERFANFLVAPVIVLNDLDGIIIAADKRGTFDETDVETLLSVGDQAAVAVENGRLEHELQHAYLATVSMLADAVEAKDPYTHGHCEEVSRYARLTAARLGLDERDVALACYSALLHDVGKIAISDGILHKPGPLLPEEVNLVRSHVRVGHDLLRGVPGLGAIAHVVLHHHERWDGAGYPEGLAAAEIPVASRIVAVVDAYCAMRDRRSYKDSMAESEARDELRRCAGGQFDPEVVEAFLAILDTPAAVDGDEDHDAECGLLPGLLPREVS